MTKLANWRIKEIDGIMESIKNASIHSDISDKKWSEDDFNLWVNTWIIPRLEKIKGGRK